MLYDTQSVLPLAVLGQLHYDSITDLAWSSDGQFLAVSSRDCYCRWPGRGSARNGVYRLVCANASVHEGVCDWRVQGMHGGGIKT